MFVTLRLFNVHGMLVIEVSGKGINQYYKTNSRSLEIDKDKIRKEWRQAGYVVTDKTDQ